MASARSTITAPRCPCYALAMRYKLALAIATVGLAAGAYGEQAANPPGQPPARPTPLVGMQPTPAGEGMLEIWQIDLDPSGTAFALGKPVLEGDAYVFKAWPDRAVVHLSQSKVKKLTQRTKNIEQEVVYRIDLLPTGRMIARENPTLKGTTYTFKTWKDGKLMSLRKADVKEIVKVTGVPAFRIQQEERGASLNDNLAMEGGTAKILPGGTPDTPAQTQQAPAPPPGNYGYPAGISEANPPPSAVVSSPGDVPKAAPAPTAPPRRSLDPPGRHLWPRESPVPIRLRPGHHPGRRI